jgi:hypothetical protein
MQGDRLDLISRDENNVAWLFIDSPHRQLEPVWLHNGFALEDVREALLATGWVREDGNELRQTNDLRCVTISDHLQAMLGYFTAPGVPGRELLELQRKVEQSALFQRQQPNIPAYAYAWLDVMVREDIADAARSASEIWNVDATSIECERIRLARVEELIARYSHADAASHSRMAGSVSTRQAKQSQALKSG